MGLQAAVFLMDLLFRNTQKSDDIDAIYRDSVAMMTSKCLHAYGVSERE